MWYNLKDDNQGVNQVWLIHLMDIVEIVPYYVLKYDHCTSKAMHS